VKSNGGAPYDRLSELPFPPAGIKPVDQSSGGVLAKVAEKRFEDANSGK
jgi:hypothetical protein